MMLTFARKVLETAGYKVLTATNSVEALHAGAAYAGTIDVLLTDVRMRLFENGLELAACFGTLRPETNVLLMSASPLPAGADHRELGWSFLPKPFSVSQLLEAVGSLILRRPAQSDWVAWAQDIRVDLGSKPREVPL
ncbi:MAG: response regulator [Fibrobacteres bacterium]|nr:response regulator [Fibrobacterota bacterium]